jgi:hypothetical protein
MRKEMAMGIKKNILLCVFSAVFIGGCVITTTTIEPEREPLKPSVEKKVILKEDVKETEIVKITGEQNVLTYAAITNLLEPFIDIEPVDSASKTPVFYGTTENELISLTIIGDMNDVREVSMKLIYPDDITVFDSDINKSILLRFLRNTVPLIENWQGRVKRMTDKFSLIKSGSVEKESLIAGNRVIDILYDKKKDNELTVTVK